MQRMWLKSRLKGKYLPARSFYTLNNLLRASSNATKTIYVEN